MTSRPAYAAGDPTPSRDRVSTTVPDAASRSVELINRERAAAGLPALALDDEVTGIAARWSRHMAADGRLSHNDDYLSQQSMEDLDATILGENVAYADTVERIHELLMQSPPHRRNILHRDYRLVGIAAVLADDGQMYLTQDFLTRRSAATGSSAHQPAPQARDRRSEQPRPRPAPARPGSTRPERRPAAAPGRPAATPARPAPAPARAAATRTRPAATPARPAAPAPSTPTAASAAPPGTSAPMAVATAVPPVQPAPEPATAPATTAAMPDPTPPVASTPEHSVNGPSTPPGADAEETEAPAEGSSPWSRASLLRAAPLLGLALRPRHGHPGH